MGRIRAFDIIIDGWTLAEGIPVYRPGGYVTGMVHFTLNTPRDDVKEISIKFQGRARTNWSEMVGSRANVLADQSRVAFSGTETYVDEKISLWEKVNPHHKLNRGPYAFPFQFQVPNECLPPAYEGTSGHVRYRLKCEISGDSSRSYAMVSKTIAIVARPLDLNCILNAMLPVADESESLLSSLCCITGSIKVVASTDRHAYVPGETAYITASVQGSSGTRYDVALKLIEEATFRGTGSVFNSPGVSVVRSGACRRCRVITRKKTSGVLQRRGETTLQREPMVIPNDRPVADSGFQGCRIIDVRYFISIAPIVSRLQNSHAEVRLPITIGRVPLANLPSYHASNAHMSHPNEPPPSYETATSVRHDTSQQVIPTAFVNEAYSSMMEETTPTTPRDNRDAPVDSASPCVQVPRDVLSNQTEASEGRCEGRSLPLTQTPLIVSAGTDSRTDEVGVRGLVNRSFSAEVSDQEDASSQHNDREPAVEELSSQADLVNPETLVQGVDAGLQAPLPPPTLFSSPTEEIIGGSTPGLTDIQVNQHPDETVVARKAIQDGDERFSQESDASVYFLPAYEGHLSDSVFTDDKSQFVEPVGVKLNSFLLPTHQGSDSDSASLSYRVEGRRDLFPLPPPSPWRDEQLSTSSSDRDQLHKVQEETLTATTIQSQEAAPAVIKTYAWKKYISMSTEVDGDFGDTEIITPNIEGDVSDSEAKEVTSKPVHLTPKRSQNYSTTSVSESDDVTIETTSEVGGILKQEEQSPRLSPMSRYKEQTDRSPDPTPQWDEFLFGDVRITHDNSQQDIRTPSPYFHPDGRVQEDASSVSSFGSYSSSTRVSREWRRLVRNEDPSYTKLSGHEGGRGVISTLPRRRSPNRGGRQSDLGSLDRRAGVVRHSPSHPPSKEGVGGNNSNPRSRSWKELHHSTFTRRPGSSDSRQMKHTVSLPTIDLQKTDYSASRRTAAGLDLRAVDRSRKVSKNDPFPTKRMRLPSRLAEAGSGASPPLAKSSHRDTSYRKPAHTSLQTCRDGSVKKRSSYVSAVGNDTHDETPSQWPRQERDVSSSPPPSKQPPRKYLTREEHTHHEPGRMTSCPGHASIDPGEGCESGKPRLETFV